MRPRFTGLWRDQDFLKLWAGQTVSMFGSQVTVLALPLAAVLLLDASPTQMGLLSALGTLPFLAFGLFAGAWVDRMRRRPVLIVADLGRALALGSVPLAAAADRLTLGHLYAVTLIAGTLAVFFDVAYQAYLPSLLERRQLVEGNGKLEISNSVSKVAGPGIGGLLVQALSAATAIGVDAISFLLSAAFFLTMRRSEPDPLPRSGGGTIWGEIGEGLRVVRRHPLLRPIVISTMIANLCTGIATAVFVLFFTRTVGLQPSEIGIMYTIGGVGAVAAAFLAGPAARRLGVGRAILAGKLLIVLSAVLVPLAGGPTFVALGVLVVSRALGGGTVISNVNQVSLRQAVTPAHLQGRVNATNRFVSWGTLPLGSLLGGALGEVIGTRATLVVAAAGMTAAVLWLVPILRNVREVPGGEPEPVAV